MYNEVFTVKVSWNATTVLSESSKLLKKCFNYLIWKNLSCNSMNLEVFCTNKTFSRQKPLSGENCKICYQRETTFTVIQECWPLTDIFFHKFKDKFFFVGYSKSLNNCSLRKLVNFVSQESHCFLKQSWRQLWDSLETKLILFLLGPVI